jgi:hypothetical protein
MADLDFELEIRSIGGRDYQVALLRSPAGEAHATMRFPYDDLILQVRLQALEIALLRSGGGRRRLAGPEEQSVLEFGRDLFDALVSGEVRSRFDVSRTEAKRQGKALRIKLRFDSPALAAIPWEFMYDVRGAEYLALSTSTPLVRYIELPNAIEPLLVTGPLRILGMVASPNDLASLDVDRERLRIQDATKDLQARGLVEIHWLERATWRDLQQALRREKWHVFHFVGHGGFDPSTDEGLIALVDDDGGAFRLPATELARLLGDHQPLRLTVLNACEGARGSSHDLFSSTAATVVRRGTPAVVAMQYEITDRAAIEFSRSFYEAIADGLPVDVALAEARKSVSVAISNTLEWGTPVLFMRSADGILFKIRRPKSTTVMQKSSQGVTAGTEIAAVLPVAPAAVEGAGQPSDIAELPMSPVATVLDRPPDATASGSVARSRARSPRFRLLAGGLIAAGVIALGGMSVARLFGAGPFGPSANIPLVSPSTMTQPKPRDTARVTPSLGTTATPMPTPIPTPIATPRPPPFLVQNGRLDIGQELISPLGKYKLQLTIKGDLVLTRTNPAATVWVAGRDRAKPGFYASMQGSDGNFVLYTHSDLPTWASGTIDHPGAALYVMDSGNLVVKARDGTQLWASKYDRGCRRTQPECSSTVKYN